MQASYILPTFNKEAFHCPHCHVYSVMKWERLLRHGAAEITESFIVQSSCTHCNKSSYWFSHPKEVGRPTHGKMISPELVSAPLPHADMPADVKEDYEEARHIATHSPRAAAALLRLAIQKLCVHLGEPGKSLDDDIESLVQKGLPVLIQQALDILRVIGSHAIARGEINSADVTTVASSLFELVNHIVDARITHPSKLQVIFNKLPQDAPLVHGTAH
jgi:hypothetical protein